MFILTVHWDVRLLWATLTVTAKFFILFLFAATVYSTCSLARVAIRLRRLLKHAVSTDVSRSLTEMTRAVRTLRQFHTVHPGKLRLAREIKGIDDQIAELNAGRKKARADSPK
jgi:hypothetical protein